MTRVELHTAYVWDCDECGRENFGRLIEASLSEEEKEELRVEHGVDEEGTGDWLLSPRRVKCEHCGANFEAYRE